MNNTWTWASYMAKGVLIVVGAASLTGCGSGGSDSSGGQQTLESKVESAVGSDITVQESGNTITLTGTVSRPDQIKIAETVASSQSPGKTIVNNLSATSPGRPAPDQGQGMPGAQGRRPAPGMRP